MSQTATTVQTTPFETLDVDLQEGVLLVTFNRPERRNSFTMKMCVELGQVFDMVDVHDDVRVVILTGTGPSFCAGADLNEGFIYEGQDMSAAQRAYVDTVGTINGVVRDGGGWLSLRIARSLKPVIVAFNGSAVGVGVTMTLPADIRIASASARFGLVFTRRGIVPEAASSWFLPRIVGISKAAEWVLTGRIFDAVEAHDAGLVNYVVPDGELVATARELALEIALNTSAVSVAASRRMLWQMLSAPSPWDAHALDSRAMFELSGAADCAEGVASFLEKRPARFPMSVAEDLPGFVPDWPAKPDHVQL